MVDIKDLEVKIPGSFKIKTKNIGELEFRYPTLKQHNIIQKFASSRKNAREAFRDLAHSLLIKPKLPRDKLSELSEYQLKNIGIILLNSHALKTRYNKIKNKHKYGNFFDKLRKVFKDYDKKLMGPFKDLSERMKRYTFPQLETLQSVSKQIEMMDIENTLLQQPKWFEDQIKLAQKTASNMGLVADHGLSDAIFQQRDLFEDQIKLAQQAAVDIGLVAGLSRGYLVPNQITLDTETLRTLKETNDLLSKTFNAFDIPSTAALQFEEALEAKRNMMDAINMVTANNIPINYARDYLNKLVDSQDLFEQFQNTFGNKYTEYCSRILTAEEESERNEIRDSFFEFIKNVWDKSTKNPLILNVIVSAVFLFISLSHSCYVSQESTNKIIEKMSQEHVVTRELLIEELKEMEERDRIYEQEKFNELKEHMENTCEEEENKSQFDDYVVIEKSEVMEANSYDAKPLGILQPNMVVTLIREEDGWCLVSYMDYVHAFEAEGWIRRNMITEK